LNEPERAAHIDHSTERIIPVGFAQLDGISLGFQKFGQRAELGRVRIDSQIEVLGLAGPRKFFSVKVADDFF